jgi:hypothetical protein
MNAPPGQYLFTQYLEDRSGRRISARHLSVASTKDGSAPYIRIRQRGAPTYAHLYTRDLKESANRDLAAVVVYFHEIPPGAIGTATVLAAVLSAFVLALGPLVSQPYSLNSYVPALLLALPAVSAGLLGQNLDTSRLANTSLKTRMGLAVTLLLSGIGIVLYLAQGKGYLRFPLRPLGTRVSILSFVPIPIMDKMWLVLFGLSALNFVVLALHTATRTFVYRTRIARRPIATR